MKNKVEGERVTVSCLGLSYSAVVNPWVLIRALMA